MLNNSLKRYLQHNSDRTNIFAKYGNNSYQYLTQVQHTYKQTILVNVTLTLQEY